jgi:PPOX class probable F420-dependent enzyme
MAATLEGRPREIIAAPNYAHLSIPRRDGTVQTLMIWADVRDGKIMINSAEGRQWPDNLRRAGTATITVLADSNPYEWVSVTARLADDTHDGADESIDALAKKYLGVDSYPYRQAGEQRVKFLLEPERVHYNAPR